MVLAIANNLLGENTAFQTAKAVISTLAVTNDHGERGVALVPECGGLLPKDKEQLQ